MKSNGLPEDYLPFEKLIICGNEFFGFVPIAFNKYPVFLVGKGKGTHPAIWISEPASLRGDELVYLVQSSSTTFRGISVRFSKNSTTVLLDQTVVLRAETLSEDIAEIPELDLRPLGINVYGNRNGLYIGTNFLQNNSFIAHTMVSLGD